LSYLVLARKWRPQNFDEVIGQEHIVRTLTNAIAQNKIHHAFLFTGSRGVGKTTSARLLAKALCCEKDGPTAHPCGVCTSCKSIAAGNSVDVLEIDGASNTGVDSVRDLRDKVQYRPQHARYKIYIIDEVHMLSTAAFNALLKTLEEPPEHVKFIFATTESHKIPQTILSRCQRYDFKLLSETDMVKSLEAIIGAEGYSAEDGVLRMVARMARGSMRDSQSLMDRVLAYAEDKFLKLDDARTVLGVIDSNLFHAIGHALVERNPEAAFDAVEQLSAYGHDLRQFGQEFIGYLRNCVLCKSHPKPQNVLDLPEGELDEIKKVASQAEMTVLTAWFDLMVVGQEQLARAEQPRYILEMTLAKMLQIAELKPLSHLLAELGRAGAGGQGGGGGSSSGSSGGGYRRGSSPVAGGGAQHTYKTQQAQSPQNPQGQQAEQAEQPKAAEAPKQIYKTGEQLGAGELPAWWKALVESSKKIDRLLWGALQTAGVKEGEQSADILYNPGNGVAEKLTQKGVLAQIEKLASDLLDKPYSLKLVERGDEDGEAPLSLDRQRRMEGQKKRAEARQTAESDPLVVAVRKQFEGGDLKVKLACPTPQ